MQLSVGSRRQGDPQMERHGCRSVVCFVIIKITIIVITVRSLAASSRTEANNIAPRTRLAESVKRKFGSADNSTQSWLRFYVCVFICMSVGWR